MAWAEQVGRSVWSPPRRLQRLPLHRIYCPSVHRPRESSLTCSRRPRSSLDPRAPEALPCRCSLLPCLLKPLALSFGFLSPSRSFAKHSPCVLKLHFTPSRVAAIAASGAHGEGGNPVVPSPRFLLLLLPCDSVKLNHPPFWLVFFRVRRIWKFPSFGRKCRPSSPASVSPSPVNSLCWQHQWVV